MKKSIRKLLIPIARLYWRIFRPKTFGVKVLIALASDTKQFLLVKHTYGDSSLWNLPGGGFNPTKETAEGAAKRELMEELSVNISTLQFLDTYQTSSEGKRDTVTIFTAVVNDPACFSVRDEIAAAKWFSQDEIDHVITAKIVRSAVAAFKRTN